MLSQRKAAVESERDELRARFASSVGEVQRRSGFKNLLLEKKLAALEEEQQQAEACLGEALVRGESAAAAATGSSSTTASLAAARHSKLEALLEGKQHTAADLAAEVVAIRTAHSQLIAAAGRKLAEFGVPLQELAFQPAAPVMSRAVAASS